jgi:hypothetical protein
MLGIAFGCLVATGEIAAKHTLQTSDTNSYNFAL